MKLQQFEEKEDYTFKENPHIVKFLTVEKTTLETAKYLNRGSSKELLNIAKNKKILIWGISQKYLGKIKRVIQRK